MKRAALLIAMFLALAIVPVTRADGVSMTGHSHDADHDAIPEYTSTSHHMHKWDTDDFSFHHRRDSDFDLFSAKGPVTDKVDSMLSHPDSGDVDAASTPMASTPEPSELILLVVGLGFVFLMRRRMVTQS